nr:unnamed protein product [Digitaria exilis]
MCGSCREFVQRRREGAWSPYHKQELGAHTASTKTSTASPRTKPLLLVVLASYLAAPDSRLLLVDGPPGLFSPSGLYTHKPPAPYLLKNSLVESTEFFEVLQSSFEIRQGSLRPTGFFDLGSAPNWAAPEPRLSLKKKFEALSKDRAESSTASPNLNPIHTKSQKIPMAGGEGSSRGKGAKRKAEATKEVITTEKAASTGDMPIIEDPISDWPTSNLKEKHIKALEADGFLAAQEISQWRCAYGHEYPTEDTEELTVPEEPQTKAGATSKGGERSKRPAPTEAQAHDHPRGEGKGIPTTQDIIFSSSARQPLSDEEILHNIFNPVSAPFIRTTPIVEEPCPAGPSAPEQEVEEEFTLGEPEIPMRPATMEEPPVDHAAVEPEAAVPEEPRVVPETTLPEVQTALPSDPPVPEGAQVEETIAEVLADIEQLVTQAVIEESEQERRDQISAEPPSVTETTQTRAEAECSRGKQTEASTQEQNIEEIPRVPRGTGAEEGIGSFRIGSYDPMLNPNPQSFEYILDAEEDEQHIDRGLYHAERAVAYFKADLLQKELEREREDRKLQEAEDADMI